MAEPRPRQTLGDEDSDDDSQELNAAEANADQEWDEWAGSDDDMADAEPTQSLFDSTILPSPEAAMDHDGQRHGFDLRKFIGQAHLDDYGVLRVINYIRSEVTLGRDPKPFLVPVPNGSLAPWDGDQYLIPPRPDDTLLCYDFEEWTLPAQQAAAHTTNDGLQPEVGTSSALEQELATAKQEKRALQTEVEQLREALVLLRTHALAAMDDTSGPATRYPSYALPRPTSLDHTESDVYDTPGPSATADNASASTTPREAQPAGQVRPGRKSKADRQVDDSYFDSYSGFNIHKEMLSDKPRTESYRQALEQNPSIVKDKAVLDVGCGTGILSLFACRGGARQVVAVDASERIVGYAKQIASKANYAAEAGGPMHVLCTKLEELDTLPGGLEKVDVIVSEWMGYALLFETMLDSVLAARDKWLSPGGVVLPDLATIYLAGGSSGALGLDFWQDVYGFSMEPIAAELKKAAQKQANVLSVDPKHITTETVTAKVLDLCTMKPEDQDFTCEFTLLPLTTTQQAAPAEVASVVLWFDTDFSPQRCPDAPVKLSTSPFAPPTHWVQTVLPLAQPVMLAAEGVQGSEPVAREVKGRLSMCRNKSKHRSLDLSLEYSAALSDGSTVSNSCIYSMNVLD